VIPRAMEADALWKAPSDLPTGLGKRGPCPVSHSSHSHDDDRLFLLSTKSGQVRTPPSASPSASEPDGTVATRVA
jgi:hypothetical protein